MSGGVAVLVILGGWLLVVLSVAFCRDAAVDRRRAEAELVRLRRLLAMSPVGCGCGCGPRPGVGVPLGRVADGLPAGYPRRLAAHRKGGVR